MRSFKELFEDYGADYAVTMGRFMGNEAMYQRFLGMLFEDDNLEKLEKSVKDRDLSVAFDAAHTLKGVSANLGLTPLYKAVCEIVEPLRSGDQSQDYEAMVCDIRLEFEKVNELWKNLREGR